MNIIEHGLRYQQVRPEQIISYKMGPRCSSAPYDPTVQPVPLTTIGFHSPGFTTDLSVRLDTDTGRWILTEPLVYRSALFGMRICVPIGFDTDFASVPRFPPIIFALVGDSSYEAAVVHDYLYRFHQVTRREADVILFEAMTSTHEPAWRDWLMWFGVRVGGWHAYHKHDHTLTGGDLTPCFV